MRVLMINTVCGVGSTGRICTDIADELERHGHECKIAYGRGAVPEAKKKYAVRVGSGFSVYLHAALSRIFDNSAFCSRHATKKFIKWVKEFKPDIVHLHNIHGYYINIKILFEYLKKADIPVVWTLHDEWAFTGHAAYCDVAGCDRWVTGCYKCPLRNSYPQSIIFDKSSRNYKMKKRAFTGVKKMTLVTPSEWLKELVGKSFLKDYPVQVINNGINTDIFKPTPSDFREKNGLTGKKIILGVASVWSERKGLRDFIKLSKMLDDSYKIVLVGIDGAQKKCLPFNILAVEKTNSSKELAEIYSAADVFVIPTYEDNYPTVNLEAQACGTPVITYSTGGSPESVPHINVVEKGDINAIKNLLVNRLPVNTNIQSRAEMVDDYMKIYSNL